jgi:O-6-methylguanine DNA methyltransferase
MLRLNGHGRHTFATARGPVGLAWTPRGLCRLEFGHADADATADALAARCPDLPDVPRPPAPVAALAARIRAALRGVTDDFLDVPVDDHDAPPFARAVWRRLRQVPRGRVITYGELAAACGRPAAARAVGRIMGANPVPLVVPCHRCVGADGSLTGFSAAGGLAQKARLLHDEGWVRDPEHARGLAHLAKADPKLRALIRRHGPYLARADRPRPAWESLVTAIIHQQLSVKAGQTIANRVRALASGAGYPTPAQVLALDPGTLRACGLSRAKTDYVRDLAARVDDGRLDLRSVRRLPDDEVIAALTTVRGIGEWSAQMHLIFHLGRLDVLATGDLGLRAAAGRLYGLGDHATPAQLAALAEPWRPYRSIASWYLWEWLDGGGL